MLDNQAARERQPTETGVEGQEMLLADQQGERDVVVVIQGGSGSAQASGRIAVALGSRVSFHAPDTTELDCDTVEGSRADYDADMGNQLALRGEHQDTIVRRRPLEVSARTHRNDFWGDRPLP